MDMRSALPFGVAVAMLLGLGTGCRSGTSEDGTQPAAVPEKTTPAIFGEAPEWPPPFVKEADRSPPPPKVRELMERLTNAFHGQKPEEVKTYFITPLAFAALCDCGTRGAIDAVIARTARAAERAAKEGGDVVFEGFGDGYLLELPESATPFGCRVKRDSALYVTKYRWKIGGQPYEGEAHFLRAGTVWFFMKI